MTTAMSVDKLDDLLRGRVIRRDDTEYQEACKLYNGMIHKHPELIACCANVRDVMTAVDYGRDSGLTVAVRGGGHSGPGLGLCDDGLVIDLSEMHGVRVDPEARTVRVEGGARWIDVDHATHAFGLATVSGIIADTGVAGLTLGGGHGYLTRKYGLTVDNLLSADVVLADGRMVTASEEKNEDLFWGLRGGGGNFGVVTSFEFRLHPVSVVHAGPTFYSIEKADEVLRWYRDFLPNAPEDLYGFFAFMAVPPVPHFPKELHGQIVCAVQWCYCGDPERADDMLRPALAFGPPIFQHVGPMPYPALQSMFDPLYPPGLQWYWKGDFVKEIPDEAVRAHVEHGSKLPTHFSTMHLYPIDGAVHRVGKNDTAFSFRDANWSQVIVGVSDDPSENGTITQWARNYFDALHPYSSGGAYVNFMMEEGDERVRATYRENYDRLVRIKQKYDPENLFHVNQNVKPDSGSNGG